MPRKPSQTPCYPSLAKPRARPVLAGVKAALLGVAALGTGCGMGSFDPRDELEYLTTPPSQQQVADVVQQVIDGGTKPADAGPDQSDFFGGGAPAPDWPYDAGQNP